MSGDNDNDSRPPGVHKPGECLNCDLSKAVFDVFMSDTWKDKLKDGDGKMQLEALAVAGGIGLRDVMRSNPGQVENIAVFFFQMMSDVLQRPLMFAMGDVYEDEEEAVPVQRLH